MKSKEGNIEDTWGIVREVIGCEKIDMSITNVKTNNRIIDDKLEIANYMGDYFSKIGRDIQNEVSRGGTVNINTHPLSMQDGFELVPYTAEEVEKTVCSLKSNSSGVEGLNLKAFNFVSVCLLPVLVYLINLPIVTGLFLSELKRSKIIPLHKGGDPSDPCNWQPISILPLFSKIYEKVIYKRLYDFLDSKKILYDGQFGFRSKYSTSHAVHHLLSFVDIALENNMVLLTVFVDFRKAFDTVDFNTLLSRLSGHGLGSTCVKWFSSYLDGRTIKVALSDILSREFGVKCAVPQGSVLGPLLHLIYVDSLASHVGEKALTSFVDDTAITVIGSCLVQVVHKANLALERLDSFTVGSSLKVNASKTNYIVFSRTSRLHNDNNNIFCGHLPIKQVFEIGFLEFYLDNIISEEKHCSVIGSKMARGLGILRRVKKNLSIQEKFTTFKL